MSEKVDMKLAKISETETEEKHERKFTLTAIGEEYGGFVSMTVNSEDVLQSLFGMEIDVGDVVRIDFRPKNTQAKLEVSDPEAIGDEPNEIAEEAPKKRGRPKKEEPEVA